MSTNLYLEAEQAPTRELRDVWVIVESRPVGLDPRDQGVIARARELADLLGCYVRVLAVGAVHDDEQAIKLGADRVSLAALPAGADPVAVVLNACEHLFAEALPEILLFADTPLSARLAPAIAASLDTGLVGPCASLSLDELERVVTVKQPAYDGLYLVPFRFGSGRPQVLVLGPDALGVPYADDYRSGEIQELPVEELDAAAVRTLGPADYTPPARTLAQARAIVAVGRGLGDGDGLELARRLAALLGAELAGDRTARELGWVDDAHTVGETGEVVAPAVYVALGIRGDTEHFFGMADSTLIVALHADEKAPIMKLAHVTLAGDVQANLRALIEALEG